MVLRLISTTKLQMQIPLVWILTQTPTSRENGTLIGKRDSIPLAFASVLVSYFLYSMFWESRLDIILISDIRQW